MTIAALRIGTAVPSLVRWGASPDADLVYRTLVTFGPHTRRALGVELSMPARRIADALAELEVSGAVAVGCDESDPRRTRQWSALAPDLVIASLRRRRMRLVDQRAVAESHRWVVAGLRARLGSLALPLSTPAFGGLLTDQLRYLPSRELARVRYGELLPGRRETLTINPEQAFDAESARTGAAFDRRLIAQATRMRVLGVPPADCDALTPPEPYHPAYQVRESLEVPFKLIVLDRAVALLPADPERIERGYLEVSHPHVVQALTELFEKHWQQGRDPSVGAVMPILLTAREQAIVDLLALGHTDTTTAACLRISARSVTNILRRLMDRLGVENRFQLGLALGAMRAARPPHLLGASGADSSFDQDQAS
ncbi:LuxR C-terminal-related transcriptional regulator [Actinoplanes sp. CA-030573]|uniref:helix-turn-helix transcriptional regulator n=1 Tax=Actinoplanes sp. CA-030573 TaxID=3239898 RepID=UPI003D94B713